MPRKLFRGLFVAAALLGVAAASGWVSPVLGAAAVDPFEPVVIKGQPAHPTRIVARVRPVAKTGAHAAALSASGVQAEQGSSLVPGLVVLTVDPEAPVMAAATAGAGGASGDARSLALAARIETLRASGLFAYVEPDYVIHHDAVPNDSAFTNGTLWGLRNTGQSGGTAGVDIDAVRAWDITKGSNNVIVAVLDSGVRTTHLDLSANMWRNSRENAGNGRDDDGNGYIDDIHGINSMTGTGDVSDPEGHGTHVAGTIGAAANNGQAHVGVAWNVRLMACKIFSEETNSDGLISSAVAAMDYAADHGATIINCSWGLPFRSRALADAVAALESRGVLVVAAAGNESSDNDFTPHYPSNLEFDNIVAVAAINRYAGRAGFSNFGRTSVDLGAPGEDIYSTFKDTNTSYETASGTSMAAPHVAGVAALVRAQFPSLTVSDLRRRIVNTTTPMTALDGITVSGGRVNAYRALTATGDGQLELFVEPSTGTTLYQGRSTSVVVHVTDVVGVNGATVTGTLSTGGSLTFRDNGSAPDVRANDGRYTALLNVPATGYDLTLTIHASAAGKSSAQTSLNFPLHPTAPNDNFADRLTLRDVGDTVNTHNRGATVEPGEGTIAGEYGGASLWWTWTAPANTTVTIDTTGSSFDTLLGVYTGNSVNNLTEVASNDDISGPDQPSRVVFDATAGTTYQIVVDGWEGKTGEITLALRTTVPPANDHFAGASVLTGASATVSATSINATREAGEPVNSAGGTGGSLWWHWTAPSSGTATVRVEGPHYPGNLVAVYTGDDLASLVRVAGRSPGGGGEVRELTFHAAAGVRYAISVSAVYAGTESPFTLFLSLVAGPVNDLFANRITLTGREATAQGTTLHATPETGEPSHGTWDARSSVWWTWTAPGNGTAIITANASEWPAVGLYTGASVAALTRVPVDYDSLTGRRWFRATAGTTYHIALDHSGAGGECSLAIRLVDTPVNDDFSGRLPIIGATVSVTGTNEGATRENDEPDHAFYSPSRATVWWTWTAPGTGTVRMESSDGGVYLRVYAGNTFGALTPVSNSTTVGSSLAIFHAEAGVVYQIVADTGYGGWKPFSWNLSLGPGPANDQFVDRVRLEGSAITVQATNKDATGEHGEPDHGSSGAGSSSLWWTWQAPAHGTAIVEVTGESVFTVAIYTGTSLTALAPVPTLPGRNPSPGSRAFSVIAGRTYQIAVDGSHWSRGNFTLRLEFVVPPANDSFSGRFSLSGSPVEVTADNRGATVEAGEPSHAQSTITSSLWWSWTAPESGTAVVDTAGSSFRCTVGVYTGNSVGGLTSVAHNRPYYGSTAAVAVFAATAGQTYQIAVDSPEGVGGGVRLRISLEQPPANDRFADAALITGNSVVIEANNFAAQREPGEPDHMNNPAAQTGSVWWKWVAPGNGGVTVSAAGSEFPPVFAVYTGTSLNALSIQCGTNAPPGINWFRAKAGQTYWIVVEGAQGTRGRLKLSLTWKSAPTNDAFARRIHVTGQDLTLGGSTFGADFDPGEPVPSSSPPLSASLWWSWRAPATGTTMLYAAGGYGLVVAAYTGSTVSALQPVASQSPPGPLYSFRAIAGTTYQIAVAGHAAYQHTSFQLHITLRESPANDMFASRIVVSGSLAELTGNTLHATAEAGEPLHGGGGAPNSIWWTWTAPRSGRVVIQSAAGSGHVQGFVYTGSSLSALVRVPETRWDGGHISFSATAGTTYHIAKASAGEDSIDLRLALVETPANDYFAGRTRLEGSTASARGTTLGATVELGESAGFNQPPSASVWWSWHAPASGPAVVSLSQSRGAYRFAILRGESLGNLTRVLDSNGGTYATAVFTAVAGTEYHIAVDNGVWWQDQIGEIDLFVGLVDPPPNDDFADRISIPDTGGTVTGSNLGATAASEDSQEPGAVLPSVWWSWTAPRNCVAVVSTAGSNYFNRVQVFTGSPPGFTWIAYGEPSVTDPRERRATFSAEAGATYHIMVAGENAQMGNIRLTVSPGDAPQANLTVSSAAPREGEELELRADVTGTGPFSYQWYFNGTAIEGATGASLMLPSAQHFDAGSYLVYVSSPFGFTTDEADMLTIAPAPPSGARLTNLSTRALDLTGDNVLIPGFVLQGPGTKPLLIRAVGPTLATHPYNVAGTLPNPRIVLKRFNGSGYDDVTTNDNWGTNTNVAELLQRSQELGAFALADGSADAALLVELEPGQYSVLADDPAGNTGIAIVEFYDAAVGASTSSLINISTRGYVGTGDNIMIPGFVVSDEGPKTLLIRAVGPALELAPYNVVGALADPTLAIYRRDFVNNRDDLILTNDNWSHGSGADRTRAVAAQVHAFPLPEGSKDAAFVVTLNPGVYTVHARGAFETEGVALVEVYAVE